MGQTWGGVGPGSDMGGGSWVRHGGGSWVRHGGVLGQTWGVGPG